MHEPTLEQIEAVRAQFVRGTPEYIVVGMAAFSASLDRARAAMHDVLSGGAHTPMMHALAELLAAPLPPSCRRAYDRRTRGITAQGVAMHERIPGWYQPPSFLRNHWTHERWFDARDVREARRAIRASWYMRLRRGPIPMHRAVAFISEDLMLSYAQWQAFAYGAVTRNRRVIARFRADFAYEGLDWRGVDDGEQIVALDERRGEI